VKYTHLETNNVKSTHPEQLSEGKGKERSSKLKRSSKLCDNSRCSAVTVQEVQYTGGHTRHGRGVCRKYSGVSKVNPVCGKTRVNCKVMQLWDATFDLGHAHARHEFGACQKWSIFYIRTVFGRVESESCIQQNACRKGIYAIARRENCILYISDGHARDTEMVQRENCICSTRDTKFACVKSGQYSGVSKVNLGCGKVPVNRKLCSRETRKLYQKLVKSGYILQIELYQ
jgi:hypothetical protein